MVKQLLSLKMLFYFKSIPDQQIRPKGEKVLPSLVNSSNSGMLLYAELPAQECSFTQLTKMLIPEQKTHHAPYPIRKLKCLIVRRKSRNQCQHLAICRIRNQSNLGSNPSQVKVEQIGHIERLVFAITFITFFA